MLQLLMDENGKLLFKGYTAESCLPQMTGHSKRELAIVRVCLRPVNAIEVSGSDGWDPNLIVKSMESVGRLEQARNADSHWDGMTPVFPPYHQNGTSPPYLAASKYPSL